MMMVNFMIWEFVSVPVDCNLSETSLEADLSHWKRDPATQAHTPVYKRED